jgi:hypothetical protein
MIRRLVLPLAALLVLVATPAFAAPPEMQTITFTETIHDEALTEACGVSVDTIVNGRITFFTFDGQVGPAQIVSASTSFVSTSGDNSIRYQDAGINLTRVAPDGTATLSIIGTLPVRVSGILVIDLQTGETILDAFHVTDIERVCAMLT